MPLKVEMLNLEAEVKRLTMPATMDDHCDICHELADKFDLWDDGQFPLWLSYLVSGYLRERHAINVKEHERR